jgi:hypothetical protein
LAKGLVPYIAVKVIWNEIVFEKLASRNVCLFVVFVVVVFFWVFFLLFLYENFYKDQEQIAGQKTRS